MPHLDHLARILSRHTHPGRRSKWGPIPLHGRLQLLPTLKAQPTHRGSNRQPRPGAEQKPAPRDAATTWITKLGCIHDFLLFLSMLRDVRGHFHPFQAKYEIRNNYEI
jgi:hypothetical protein